VASRRTSPSATAITPLEKPWNSVAVVRKYRLSKLPRWLAGVYLVSSLLVFFGTMGTEGHAWWPLFLHYIIWPISLIFDWVSSIFLERLPQSSPDSTFSVIDDVSGAFYIIAGTIWMWFLGRLFSRMITHFFPLGDGKKVGVTKPTEDAGN
jgi:hypothetical protein